MTREQLMDGIFELAERAAESDQKDIAAMLSKVYLVTGRGPDAALEVLSPEWEAFKREMN